MSPPYHQLRLAPECRANPLHVQDPSAIRQDRGATPPELQCLLIGMHGGGGEEVFIRDLVADPPEGVRYSLAISPHESVPGARSRRLTEIAFNRVVHPSLWPLPGLRAYDVGPTFDLVHVHVHPHHLRLSRSVPVVMSVSNSYFHYIQDYLHWETTRVEALYTRARRVYRGLGITNEMVAWERLAGISVFSEFAKNVLVARGVKRDLVTVIPPGFPTPGVCAEIGQGEDFTFLYAGRHPRRKGADLVVDGIRRLRRSGARVRAILVGDPSFLELAGEPGFQVQAKATRRQLCDDLYPQADAFAMPSRAEGYGFTLVEAMSFGLPVISTTYGSIPEVIDHGVTGLLVAPDNGEAVFEAMRALATDPAAARAMGRAGRLRFERDFTRARFLGEMRVWYDSVLARS
jgi:glycosyltransferase involved in cell wall biosynthesis